MIKLAVFDWNGTLIADTNACRVANNHIIGDYGGTPVTLKTFQDTFVIPVKNFYTLHGCAAGEIAAHSKEIGEKFHEVYEPLVDRVRPRRFAQQVLAKLSEQGIESIILSNHTTEGIERHLKRLRLNTSLTGVIANTALDSSLMTQTKEAKLVAYLRARNLNAENAILIGDAPEEIGIAHTIGAHSIAITGGYYSAQRLRATNPDYLIHSLQRIPDIVARLNS